MARSTSFRRLFVLGGALAFSVLSCGREPTGPVSGGERYAHGLAFQTEFPSAYTQYLEALAQAQVGGQANQSAGDIAEFTRVRIVLRFPDGSIAKDTTIDFPSGANEVPVSLNIALPASVPATGVTLSGSLNYLNAAGTTVWTATDVQAPVVPATPGSTPPPPVVVVPKYVGPGATATGVRISPKTLTVNTGGAFSFSAVAVDASGNVVPNTPIVFSAENAALVNVNAASGAGTAGTARGTTQIFARTLTNQFDAAVLTVLSPPSSIAAVSGGGQTANVNAQLANPVIVQVNATDGQPAPGVTVTFAAQNGGVAGSATVVTGTNGQASTTWRLGATAGTQTLTASAAGLAGSPVTFTATGRAIDPVRLFFVQQPPATTAAGSSLAPPITVQAVDATGAVTTAFTGTITISLGAGAPAGAALTGNSSAVAVAGVASFSDLKINLPGTYTLVASSGALIGATSSAFAITAGAANRLVFQNYPSAGIGAGATLDPITVVVRDALNNAVTTFTGPVTLTPVGPPALVEGAGSVAEAVASGDTLANALFNGPVTVSAVAGVATFSNLQLTKAGSYTLTASSTGLLSTNGPAFQVQAGAAGALSLVSGGGQSAPGAAALAAPIVVKVSDGFGNGIAGVTVNFTPAAGNGTANPSSGVTGPGGTTQTNWTLGNPAGSQTLNVTSTGLIPNPLAVTANATSTAGPGAAALLSISQGPPASTTAGVAFSPSVSVTAKDALNQTATSFTGNVTLAITANPGGGTLAGTVTVAAVAGVATFPGLSINKAGNGYSLTASSGTLTTATTSLFNITPAAASQIVSVSGDGQGGTVNSALAAPFVARVKDAFGNNIAGVSVSWAVASGGGSLSGTTSTTDANGLVQTLLTMGATAGVNTVTVTSAGLTGSPLTFMANSAPGAVTQLVFTGQPANTTANAFSPTIVVEARDAANNLVTSFTGAVNIQVSTNPNGAVIFNGTTGVNAVGGVATFPGGAQVIKAGTGYTLTATSAGVPNGTSASFNITAGPALLIFADSGDAQSAVAGTPVANKLVGRITDQYNNPVAGHTTVWSVTGGGGSLTATTNVTDANGRVRTGWTLGPSAGSQTVLLDGVSPSIGTIGFTATAGVGAATKLVFLQQPTNAVAGVNLSPAPVVQAQDANNNVVASYSTGVAVALSTNPGSATLGGTTTITPSVGQAAFNTLNLNKVGTGYVLTATSGGLTAAVSSGFNITAAGADAIAADSGNAQTALTGAPVANQLVGRVVDLFGNPVAGVNVIWSVTAGGGSLPGATLVTDANGRVRTGWTLGAAGPQSVTLTSGSLVGSPVTFTAVAVAANASAVWTGAQDGVWTNPNNWSPASVPAATDSLLIQAGGTSPTLSANTTVAAVYIADGATLNTGGFTLTVTGNMSAGNTIVGHVNLTGTGTMQGHVTGNVNVTGTYTVVGADSVGGSLTVGGSGSLTIGAHTVGVGGHFSTATNGVLVMTSASSVLSVSGDVGFGGGNSTLTDGLLRLKGNFLGASGFAPSGNHVTLFHAAATQSVTLSGTAGANKFNKVVFNDGTVTAQTDIWANDIELGLAIINLNALNGSISARIRNTITDPNGRWNIPTVVLTGPAVRVRNDLNGALVRFVGGGTTALDSSATLTGSVVVDSSTTLAIGQESLTIAGNFTTQNSGKLSMAGAAGVVTVAGNATFAGGVSSLVAGTVNVSGNFTQSSVGSTQSYKATVGHTTVLGGTGNQVVTFASPDTSTVGCTLSCFYTLTVSKPSGTLTFDSPVRVGNTLTATGGLSAWNAVGTAGNPRNVVVGGPNPATGNLGVAALNPGVVHFSRLVIKGLVGIGGGTVDSLEFFGPTVAAGTFGAVKVSGAGSLSGTLSAQSLVVTGALTMNGKRANVSGHFGTVGTGFLTMNNANDSLLVSGNVTFAGGNSNLSAGLITVGGNFAQAGSTANAFAASGSHLVKLVGNASQQVTFLNPDLVEVPPNASSCSLSCFASLELSKENGRVDFVTGAKFLGGLSLSNSGDSVVATGKRLIVVGSFVPPAVTTGSRIGLLSVGGTAAHVATLTVDTLIHWGTADVEILPKVQLQVWGTNAIKGSARNFLGNVALFGSGTLSFQAGSTVINGGFSTNGGTNTFTMVHDSVNVVVSGVVNLASGAASTPAAGHLHVSNNFTTNGTAFQATGTHVTHFTAQSETSQTITGSTPVAGQGLRHVMFEGAGSKVISGSLNIMGNVTIDAASPAVTGVGATVFIGGDFSDATQKELPNLRAGAAQVRAGDPRAARANAIATYVRRRAAMRAAEKSAPRVVAPRNRTPRPRTKTPAVRAVAPTAAMLAAAAAVPTVSLVDPLGGWQVENTTFAGSSLDAEVMTTNLTITGQASLSNWMEINGNVVVQKVSGSPGQLVFNGKELVVTGNFSTAASGTIKLTDESDGLFVGGNASFGGGSTAGLLTSGYLEVVGSFAQSGSNEAFKPDAAFPTYLGYIEYGCGECEFKANARASRPALRAGMMASEVMPSTIGFANPGEGAGTSHFGMLYLQGLEIDLASDVYALSTLETGEVSSIHVSTATPTKKIVSHGADVRNLSFDNVRWEVLDGAGIGSMDYVTFGTMDPTVDQFTMTRNGALPPLCDCSVFEFWDWTFNTLPTSGTYIKATDTDGATNGTLTIRMQYPNPTTHGGKISLNGGAAMQNWLTAWVWLGTFSTGWNHVNNWGTSNALPDYADDVTIPSGTTYSPRLNFDASVRSLTIASGASLELNGQSLAVHGNLSGPTATTGIVCAGCEVSQPVRLVGSGASFTVAGRFMDLQVGDPETSTLVDYKIAGGGALIVNGITIRSGDFTVNGGTLTVNSELKTEQSGRLVMTNSADQVTVTNGAARFYGMGHTGLLTAGTMTLNDAAFEANGELAPDAFKATGSHKVVLLGLSSVNFYTIAATSWFNDLAVDAGSNTTLYSDVKVLGTFKRNAGAGVASLFGDEGNTRYLTVNGIDVGTNPTNMNSVAVKMENAGTFTAFNNVTFSGFNAYTGAVVNIARAGTMALSALNFSGLSGLGTGGIYLENSGPGTVNVTGSNPASGTLNVDYKITGGGAVTWVP